MGDQPTSMKGLLVEIGTQKLQLEVFNQNIPLKVKVTPEEMSIHSGKLFGLPIWVVATMKLSRIQNLMGVWKQSGKLQRDFLRFIMLKNRNIQMSTFCLIPSM